MKTLITGIAGFAGSYLAELLLSEREEVFGTVMPGESTRNMASFESQVRLFTCDIRNADAVRELMDEARPDEIYHLAAVTFIPDSVVDPRLTFETNLYGSLNLFEAASGRAPNARILFVGSADEYGLVRGDELPISEENPLRPTNPYSVSKVSASMLAYQYGLTRNLHVVRVRPFNHTGPRQSPRFVCSDFALQIVEAEKGLREPEIRVGNLKPRRDFTDVRDVVRAYREILKNGESCEVYNISSGVSVGIGEILDILISVSGQKIKIIECSERTRTTDVKDIRGDSRKIERVTGWKPAIPLKETLEDMIEYWRNMT